MRRHIVSLVFLCVSFTSLMPGQCEASGCFHKPLSLLDRFLDATMLVVAQPQNAVPANNDAPNGQTELVLGEMVKPHAMLLGRKSIITPHYIGGKEKYLVALEIEKGRLTPYAGEKLDADGAILKYVRGGLQLKGKSPLERLRYNIDFLSDPCLMVAVSAQIEFNRADYANVRKIAETMKSEPLAKVMAARSLPTSHRAPFILMLGHCGTKEHAKLMRKELSETVKHESYVERRALLTAYALLEPKVGWDYLAKYACDPDRSFLDRYDGLLAIRTLGERKDLFDQKAWDDAMLGITQRSDMADFAIEDLRRAKRWQHADAIIDQASKPGFDVQFVQNAVLRYALQCPSPRAKAFVNEQRARDREWVAGIEETLELEK